MNYKCTYCKQIWGDEDIDESMICPECFEQVIKINVKDDDYDEQDNDNIEDDEQNYDDYDEQDNDNIEDDEQNYDDYDEQDNYKRKNKKYYDQDDEDQDLNY